MKKISRIVPLVAISALIASLIAKENNGSVIFLHKEKKLVRSSQDHLKQFAGQGLVVVQFYADWCGPCRRMSPLIDTAAQKMKNITFIKVNYDFFKDLAQNYKVNSIPTLIFLHNGQEVGRYDSGPLNDTTLAQTINRAFKKFI